ncbi:MAG: hypothetical protein JO257_07650 [Deltaproteobacteria bacterium]|nr:hypothetical protein [Deltaproteobacteria bacterium]
MNVKAFFVDALTSALDLGIARPDDVLRHVTPDTLAQHLPRPLWARLLTACLGAPRVDAQLVIETIGLPNLAEHLPAQLIWAVIADVGGRALGHAQDAPVVVAKPRTPTTPPPPRPLTAPPPPEVVVAAPRPTPQPMPAVGPDIPAPASAALADLINELENDQPAPARSRMPTAQRFRQSNTGIGRLGSAQRRPQVAATPAAGRPARRGGTEVSDESVGAEIAVDDSQLVDWSSAEQTQATDDDFTDLGRKR